ncbi:hypothetical protein [Pontiella sp.]|uniref:hypothetical protein n=1 Tax=Pontiella sp. TaxID=2837462 RepID=UPI00356A74B3
MFILCDTCVLLMLLRIAPDMLTDERYNCVAPPIVRDELFRTQKFKDKYPWRTRYKTHVQTLPASLAQTEDYSRTLQTIDLLVSSSINARTGRRFGLSKVDKMLAAHVVANKYQLSTGDFDLRDFLFQEFDVSNVSPLEIINDWLARELIEWNDARQAILEDWKRCNEHRQPKEHVKNFKAITGRDYPAD